jgi:hypothetical protein
MSWHQEVFMLRKLPMGLCVALVSIAAFAAQPITIDASSEQSAQESYTKMFESLSDSKRIQLQMAILKINMDGIGSASEMMAEPELRNPGIKRIRNRVAGMTADQIIDEAKKVTSVKLVVPSGNG